MFAHLGRAGGTVEADHVDPQCLQRVERGADLRTQQHRAGGLHRDVNDDRRVQSERRHRVLSPDDSSFRLQQILRGFDQHRIRAALQQPGDVFRIGSPQSLEINVAQRGQLGARTD